MVDKTVATLTAASALDGTELYYGVQASADTKVTGAQIATLARSASSGALGYATGAGGTVTQLTSRTTGVTLNKLCGAITLFTAAGSTAYTTFTVTNSTVAITDTVILTTRGTNAYLAFCSSIAAGSFNITFNTSGGTASDTPVFNFAVIKAVTA